jgi:hypothetical protein
MFVSKDVRCGGLVRALSAATGCWCLLITASSVAAEQPAAKDFRVVAHAVERSFASLPGYVAGDLVSRSQIRAALVRVQDAGWDVPQADEIVERGLAEDSFLVARLSTPAGRKFMRKVAGEPGAYARLDRLSSISRGETLVNDLIRRKGGDEMIRYLATTQGGRQLGRQLAATRNGVDINKPTGRIYTAADLIAVLKQIWDAERVSE